MKWIEEVLLATQKLESPKDFWVWSSLAIISAVVKNNIYIEREAIEGMLNVYPNIYVLISGPSGVRKGPPCALAKLITKKLPDEVQVISGRSSIQAIVNKLGTARTVPGTKGPKINSKAFITSGEFSTSLVKDPDSLTIFTDLYDGNYNKDWDNTLKHSAQERLEDINITILGAINDIHFNDMMSKKEIMGGFIARTHLIWSEEVGKRDSLLRKKGQKKEGVKIAPLIEPLKRLVNFKGEMVLTDDAIDEYDKWYQKYDPKKLDDRTGAARRLDTHILKIAQLVTCARMVMESEELKLEVTKEDLIVAMDICFSSIGHIKELTRPVESDMAQKNAAFLRILLSYHDNYKVSRELALIKGYGMFDFHDMDRLEQQFVEMGVIKAVGNGNFQGEKHVIYELTDRTINEYKEKFK